MAHKKKFEKPYKNGWVNSPYKKTPITAEILNNYDAALESIENWIEQNAVILDRFSQSNGLTMNAGPIVSDLNDIDYNCTVCACSYPGTSIYVANCPQESSWFYVQTLVFTEGTGFRKQIAHSIYDNTMWVRTYSNSQSWTDWVEK